MTKASLIKLLLLVILAFIICLPEFFGTHSASRVNFLCLTHQLCKIKSNGRPGNAEEMRKDMCDGFWSPAPKTWEQICSQKNQSNRTDLRMPESQETRTDPVRSWFLCEADKNMEELYNISASGEWWCTSRVIWLFLLCVVLLTVFTAVIRQIDWRKLLGKKSKLRPVSHCSPSQKLNAVEKKSDAVTLKEGTGSFYQSYGLKTCSKLPPIQEVGSQSEIEILLNENTEQSFTGSLHHHVHTPTFVDVVTKKHLRSSESNFCSTEDK